MYQKKIPNVTNYEDQSAPKEKKHSLPRGPELEHIT
jgi:hypothetical protein